MLKMSEKSFCLQLGRVICRTVEAFTELWYIVVTERNANVWLWRGAKIKCYFFLERVG